MPTLLRPPALHERRTPSLGRVFPTIPYSGLLAAWGACYLAGRCSLDDAISGIAPDEQILHRVVDSAGDPESWALTLGQLRSSGAMRLRLVLPASGDFTGLPGPPPFNSVALHIGECALSDGNPPWGFIPGSVSEGFVAWSQTVVTQRPLAILTLGQETRAFAEAVAEGSAALEALDVARGRELTDPVIAHADRELSLLRLPPTLPPRAVSMIGTATRLRAALRVARGTEGAALTAAEVSARALTLAPLDRAVRRALEAGYSALPA